MSESRFPIAIRAQLKHGILWEALRRRGWTQKQGAEFVGVDHVTFGRWVNMRKRPKEVSPLVAAKLFELTRKSVSELWPEKVFTQEFLTTPKTFEATRAIPVRMLGRATAFATLPAGPASEGAEQKELRALIGKVLGTLNPKDALIVRKHFLEGMTHAAIGREIGLSRERVRQLCLEAVRRLQHPVRRRKLESFLGE